MLHEYIITNSAFALNWIEQLGEKVSGKSFPVTWICEKLSGAIAIGLPANKIEEKNNKRPVTVTYIFRLNNWSGRGPIKWVPLVAEQQNFGNS
jgi:hypothetical protein